MDQGFSFSNYGETVPGLESLTATGLDQSSALPIKAKVNHFGTVPPGSGALLPFATASTTTEIHILNRGANQLLVYPAPNTQIEGLPLNQPVAVAAGETGTFHCFDPVTSPGRTWSFTSQGLPGIGEAPLDGEVYGRSMQQWVPVAAEVSMTATPPASPRPGALWWDTVSGQLFTYFNDGNSSQWVIANNVVGLSQAQGDARYLQLSGEPYFGIAAGSLVDLITSQPATGIYQTAGASNIQAEPILGPHWGKDFTRAQSVSYLTTTLGSGIGEYAHLYNLKAQTGYPSAWQPNHAYLLYDTVTNGGNLYSVTTAGTSAASGGPTGTGSAITDGSVVWMYRPDNQAANGGKVNLGVFTYADVNSGHAWGIANDLQISAGTNKVAAFAQEIDLNNYRMDYNTGLPGPSAVALQIFAGGPNRSSYAIGIAAQGTPTDPANFVYGMLMQGAKLVSDVDVWLSTGAATGVKVDGTRSATNSTAFYAADNSQNAIIIGGNHTNQDIWITDTAPTVLTVGGTHTNVVNITGTISGVAWAGAFSATSINSTPIGATTASTGAFTTLSASDAVSGAGFSTYLASPPVLGGTAPNAGTFTNLAANGLTTGSASIISVNANNASAVSLQFNGTSQNSIYCADTSQHGIIFGGTHSNSDIWVVDNAPTFALIGGTHTNIIDVSGATISGLGWSGPLSATSFVVSAAAGPTIRAGTGAATGTQPKGSIWLRTDGAAGSTLYVTQGGGTWAAVAGV